MGRREYVVDSDLRESANSRANPGDTLEDHMIDLRNDDDRFNVKHNGECLNLESRNLVPGDLKKLSSMD